MRQILLLVCALTLASCAELEQLKALIGIKDCEHVRTAMTTVNDLSNSTKDDGMRDYYNRVYADMMEQLQVCELNETFR